MMIILKRNIKRNRYLIKEIINQTSEMYDNFSHFIIKADDKIDDWLTIVLYFDESENDIHNKTEKVVVEYLEDVFYNDITEIAKNSAFDFPGFVKMDVLRQLKKKHMADVILTYKVPKDTVNYNLSHIIKTSWCGGRHSQGYSTFEFYKYTGLDNYNSLFSQLSTDMELRFNYGNDYIIISKCLNIDTEKYLFKLQLDQENSNKIRITKFIQKEDRCYRDELCKEVFLNEISVEDMNLFINDLFERLEKEFNKKISKSSYNYFKNHLQSSFENKIKYSKKDNKI